jgi:prevent-host-death family protein
MYKLHVIDKLVEQNMTSGAKAKTYTASEARNRFADLFNEAFYEGPVIVKKSSKSVAVISLETLELLTEQEAQGDAHQAREALREFLAKGGKSWNELKSELKTE